MEYKKLSEKYYVRLDKGDEVVSSLISLCEKEGVKLAQVQGIGGCERVTAGVFDLEKKIYNEETVSGMLEMISLDGNITAYEEKPFLHAHAVFAYKDGNVTKLLSGHLLSAVIGLTGEIVLTPANGRVTRRFDEENGIKVWDFEN